jgi:hypothetical protein
MLFDFGEMRVEMIWLSLRVKFREIDFGSRLRSG